MKGPYPAKIQNCVISTCTLRILLGVKRYQDRWDLSFRCGDMAASLSATPEWWFQEKLQFQRLNFPYTIALARAIRLHLLSCDYSPRLSAWTYSWLVFGFVWRHGGAFFVVLR